MPALFVTEQGSELRKTGDRLLVMKDDQELLEIECFKIDAVFLVGGVELTTPAVVELLQHGITLVLLTRDGRLKGRLVPPMAKNSILRARQYGRWADAEFSLAVARSIVAAKLENCAELLARHARNHTELPLEEHVQSLRRFAEQATMAQDMHTLLGTEGAAGRQYFEAFALCCRRELEFPGRIKRPPTDPINALLSLGYVMLGAQILAILEGMGFDPYLGLYHRLVYGRPSLALDLLEEFRVIIDQLVLRITNLGVLGTDDFERNADSGEGDAAAAAVKASVRLTQAGFRKFVQAYGERMEGRIELAGHSRASSTVINAVRRQAERLAASIIEGEPYEGCRLRL